MALRACKFAKVNEDDAACHTNKIWPDAQRSDNAPDQSSHKSLWGEAQYRVVREIDPLGNRKNKRTDQREVPCLKRAVSQ